MLGALLDDDDSTHSMFARWHQRDAIEAKRVWSELLKFSRTVHLDIVLVKLSNCCVEGTFHSAKFVVSEQSRPQPVDCQI